MKYNFDKKFDRSLNKTRKWDKNLISQKLKKEYNENIIPMDIADMDFEVAPNIKEAILKVANSGDYNYSYVYDETYESIINWNKKRFNINLEKEWIKIAFGTCSVIHYILQAFCNENDSVLINLPCYEPFVLASKRANLNIVFNELEIKNNRYYINFEKLEKDMIDNKIKVYILCSPQNPSGRIWTREELEKISKLCIKYNVLLIADEVHRDILRKNKEFISIYNLSEDIKNKTILCVSPNKTFNLGGLKGSYVIIKNNEIREKFLNYLEKVYITSPHVFMQSAFISAYNECETWLEELSIYLDNNFKYFENYMKNNFEKIEVMEAESSFLVWINMKKIFEKEEEIKSFFEKIEVIPVLGSYFSLEKDSGWLRLNLACRFETLKEILNRFKNTLNI